MPDSSSSAPTKNSAAHAAEPAQRRLLAPPIQPPSLAIQVIERMLTLLDALAKKSEPVSLKELSQSSGLHPSTAHRILNDLVLARMVDRTEPGSYQLGMRLLELGNLVKARLNVRDAAAGPMRELPNTPTTRALTTAPPVPTAAPRAPA